MADVGEHKARWQLKKDETFRVRFRLTERPDGRPIVSDTGVKGDETTVEHWVELKMWDYQTMIRLRKEATRYHNESRTFFVDQDLFDELKVKNLMKSWSFGEVDPHLKLVHFNNVLVDESLNLFKSLYPWVTSTIIGEMNLVLEGYRS